VISYPAITIVIPTYNRLCFLIQALKSLELQSCKNFSAIVVDDGSTDSSDTVLEYKWTFELTYIKQLNSERGAARNNGIRHCSTDYIYFMDSDDTLLDNHVYSLINFIIHNHFPAIVAANYIMRDERDVDIFRSSHSSPLSGNDLLTGNPLACNFAIKRNAIPTLFNESRSLSTAEDWLFLLESCFCSNQVIHVVPEATVVMLSHNNRSMSSGSTVGLARIAASNLAVSILPLNPFQRRILRAHSFYIAAVHFYLGKNTHQCFINIISALKQWPSPYIIFRACILLVRLFLSSVR
jgi:glycosyltransferase involved in cell wall biosynthesis